MVTHLPRRETHPRTAGRQAAARLRRIAAVLATVTYGLLASAAVVPAAFATMIPDPGGGGGGNPAGPGDYCPCGRRQRHGGLADHLDRAWRRPSRSHCAVVLDRTLAARRAASATAA
jgi:hypothetical protein